MGNVLKYVLDLVLIFTYSAHRRILVSQKSAVVSLVASKRQSNASGIVTIILVFFASYTDKKK